MGGGLRRIETLKPPDIAPSYRSDRKRISGVNMVIDSLPLAPLALVPQTSRTVIPHFRRDLLPSHSFRYHRVVSEDLRLHIGPRVVSTHTNGTSVTSNAA